MERYTLEQYERVMRGEAPAAVEATEAEPTLTTTPTSGGGDVWRARQALFQDDEARAARYSRYPIGSDSFGARAERATFTAMKVVFVILPVAAILLWLVWSVITG